MHQFVRIGAHAFVGGGSRVPQDVPPYCRAAGNPPRLFGLNSVGLKRGGFSEEESLEVVRLLGEEQADLIEISGGTYERAAMWPRR